MYADLDHADNYDELVRSLSSLPGASVATLFVDRSYGLLPSPLTLRRLSSLYHLKFVCGNPFLYQLAKREYRLLLASLSPGDLPLLWHGDIYRSSLSQYVGSSIELKERPGGTIDYDFGRILHEWIFIQEIIPRRQIVEGLRVSKLFIRFLCIAKYDLPAVRPSPVLGWHRLVALVTKSHRSLLESILRDMTQSSARQGENPMDTILKLFSRAYIHAILIALGALLVVVSIVAKVPGVDGGEIVLRRHVDIPVLVIGSVFMLIGIGLAVYVAKSPINVQEMKGLEAATTLSRSQGFEDLIHMPGPPEFEQQKPRANPVGAPRVDLELWQEAPGIGGATDTMSPDGANFSQRVRDRFLALSSTQKKILSLLYRIIHSTEVSVDDLVKNYNDKHQDKPISGSAEMYYRLSCLGFLGFLVMRGIGDHSTMVVKVEAVSAELLNGDLLDS